LPAGPGQGAHPQPTCAPWPPFVRLWYHRPPRASLSGTAPGQRGGFYL